MRSMRNGGIEVKDFHEEQRKQFLRLIDTGARNESAWWWAVAVAAMFLLVMLAAYVGPVVFPAG